MNGPEHYAEAERLVAMHADNSAPAHQDWAAQWGAQTLAAAQVHATLALTAATAAHIMSTAARGDWSTVVGGDADGSKQHDPWAKP